MLLCFLVVLRQCAYLIEVDTWLIWGDKRMYWKEFISRYVVTMTSWHVWHCNRKKTRLWLTYFIKVTTPSKRVPTQYRPRSYCRPCRIILLWRSDVVEMIVDLSFWSMVVMSNYRNHSCNRCEWNINFTMTMCMTCEVLLCWRIRPSRFLPNDTQSSSLPEGNENFQCLFRVFCAPSRMSFPA